MLTRFRQIGLTVAYVLGCCAGSITGFAQDCGPCSNCADPLVQVKDISVGGDLGDLPETSQFHGWNLAEVDGLSQFVRGIDYLEWREKNPCADIYFLIFSIPADRYIRVGPKSGDAKYTVESEITLLRETQGRNTIVRHVVEKQTRLPEGGKHRYDVETVSDQVELVDLVGQVKMEHKLGALKNNQTYDSEVNTIDWVEDPPPDEGPEILEPGQSRLSHSYFSASGERIVHDGQVYTSNDGLIVGRDFSKSSLASLDISFPRGDIGVTIRRMETPLAATLEIDDRTGFPPHYKLHLRDITNEFGEPLPDNVKIALKAEKGSIDNGKYFDQDWRIFSTKNGEIPEAVLYEPPDCGEAKQDTLVIRGVCDFHDGPISIGANGLKKSIPNSKCYDLSLSESRTITVRGQQDYPRSKGKLSGTLRATVFMTFEHVDTGKGAEEYKCKTLNYSFSMTSDEEEVDPGSPASTRPKTWTRTWKRRLQSYEVEYPAEAFILTLRFDKNHKKVLGVYWGQNNLPYRYKLSSRQTEGGTETTVRSGAIDMPAGYALHEPAPKWRTELNPTTGDGVNFFGGTVEKDSTGTFLSPFELQDKHVQESDIYRWSISRRVRK